MARQKFRDCVVCGEQFQTAGRPHAKTCGPVCSKARRQHTKKEWRPTYAPAWRVANRQHVRAYDAAWQRAKRAARTCG